ncbi:MAG: hypothetical protein ACFE7S_05660 [Candidatus Hodarchaeota archaeon]
MKFAVRIPKRSKDLKDKYHLVEEEDKLLETLKQLGKMDPELHVICIERK